MGNASIADLPPHIQRQVRQIFEAEDAQRATSKAAERIYGPKRKSKFNNTRTPHKSVQGFERVYDSKAEAAWAAQLDIGIQCDLVRWWLPQPSIPLPGGVVYRADFLVQYSDRLAFVDVKGKDTQASINKRKQVKDLFGIDVELVRK